MIITVMVWIEDLLLRKMGKNRLAPIMGIDRLRFGTDGKGITSLVTFYGCPLNCQYCLNPQCHKIISDSMYLRPEEVFNRIAVDELYYLASGGGVTFGGGEPLLYPDFIIDVLAIGADKWNVTIETSLNVPYKQVSVLLPYVNEMIVDIKDMNSHIYKSYTQSDNYNVIENLKLLANNWCVNNVLLRIPLIKGYNTNLDIENSMNFLTDLGYSNFDVFEYKTDFKNDRKREMYNS